jgi:hypothetical protein
MRFVILNSDYGPFLDQLYAEHHGLESASYLDQLTARYDSLFASADFYSSALQRLGHEAIDIFHNNAHLQLAWAREHGLRLSRTRAMRFRLRRGIVPWVDRDLRPLLEDILVAQVRHYQPDVLLNQDPMVPRAEAAARLRPHCRVMAAQVARSISQQFNPGPYDFAISSMPATVEAFQQVGLPAYLSRLCFEPSVRDIIGLQDRVLDAAFVGSYHATAHRNRMVLLERIAEAVDSFACWGSPAPDAEAFPSFAAHYRGTAWGRGMYEIFSKAKIVINDHLPGPANANNYRLFEATGMGAALVTDRRPDLGDLFEVGREVVDYGSAEDAVKAVQRLLSDDAERSRLATAGQRRTLADHTYDVRMREFVSLVEAGAWRPGRQLVDS